MKYFLVIDFETSGLLEDGGQPVEMGAVLLDKKDLTVLDEFQIYIKFDPSSFIWSQAAEDTHGITIEELDRVGVPMEKACGLFVDWIGKWIDLSSEREILFCGQNIIFDLRFLQVMAGVDPLQPLTPPWACPTFRDTMQWAGLINQAQIEATGFRTAPFKDPETGNPSVSLEALADSLGFPFTDSHSALEDARMAANVMRSLIHHLAEDLSNSGKYERRKKYIQQGRAAKGGN